jgi:hypothetical protein
MPKEIKVFSMSVLDLLTCALGGTLLISFLLIVSLTRPPAGGFPYAYYGVTAEVWVDVTDVANIRHDADGLAVRLLATPGQVTGQLAKDAEALRSVNLPELRVYRRLGKEVSVPGAAGGGGSVKAWFEVNPKYTPPDEESGQKIGSADGGVLWCAVVEGRRGVFAVYRLNAAGFDVERGWYFVELRMSKRDNVGAKTAAWLRIDSGGVPGVAVYQTAPRFPDVPGGGSDAAWPFGQGVQSVREQFPKFDNFGKVGGKHSPREKMTLLGLPDFYAPRWPAGYLDAETKADPPQTFGLHTGGWIPYFALRQPRGSAPPAAARFPVAHTDKWPDAEKSPGWHRKTVDAGAGKTFDDYLPGFEIRDPRAK